MGRTTRMKLLIRVGLFLIALSTAQHSYASCSDEWLSCRKAARESLKDCKSSCDNSNCRRDCEDTLKSDYDDCNTAKSECRSSEESEYSNSQSRYREPQFNRPASICSTNFGPCPMMVRVPIGTSCYCMTPAGQVWGIAQ